MYNILKGGRPRSKSHGQGGTHQKKVENSCPWRFWESSKCNVVMISCITMMIYWMIEDQLDKILPT